MAFSSTIDLLNSFLFLFLSLSLKKTIQRELYKSAARIVDSSSVAPRAPERKVRSRERGVFFIVYEKAKRGKEQKIDLVLLSTTRPQQNSTKQDPEPLLPPTLASDAAATWNGAVDATLGPAVRALAKRGL